MVYTLIDHRNDVIECSKLKWNHEPQAFILVSCEVSRRITRAKWSCFSYFCSTFATSSTILLSDISPHMLKFGSSLSMLRSKIIFTKKQKQYNRHCVTCDVIRAPISNRSQMTSKCDKNNEVAHEPQASVSLMFLTTFWRPLWSLLNRPTATRNLFFLYNEQKRKKTDTYLLRTAWLFEDLS